LADEVTGATEWHINADEPDILDYDTTFKQPAQDALFEPNAFRSSDHDAVIVGLDSCDEIAPTLEVSVTPNRLWPPNHSYVAVEATVVADDNFDSAPAVELVSAVSNEPDDAPGGGDGNRTNDIVIVDNDTLRLRAERDETRTGRIYTITYRATDACGNTTTQSATVTVPVRTEVGFSARIRCCGCAGPSGRPAATPPWRYTRRPRAARASRRCERRA
jgi:hypothetical protein